MRVLQTLVMRTLLVMQFPMKARSIPASERVASATLWAHGRFQHAGRPICAFACLVPCPIALHEAVQQGRIQKGQLVLLAGFGAGLTWGASLVRW